MKQEETLFDKGIFSVTVSRYSYRRGQNWFWIPSACAHINGPSARCQPIEPNIKPFRQTTADATLWK